LDDRPPRPQDGDVEDRRYTGENEDEKGNGEGLNHIFSPEFSTGTLNPADPKFPVCSRLSMLDFEGARS
jgi:hypothetical protein